MICLSVAKNVLNTTFGLVNRGRPYSRRMRFLNDGLDKVLCRMRKSLINETLYEVSIVFQKRTFCKGKKNIKRKSYEKKVIKSLTVFHNYVGQNTINMQDI